MSWMLIWKLLLLLAIGCFAVMAVVVTIGGAADIRRLFQRLREDKSE